MGVTLVSNGNHHRGHTPESVVRRLFGRSAEVIYSPDRNNPRPVMAVRRDGYGTHVLGEYVSYDD